MLLLLPATLVIFALEVLPMEVTGFGMLLLLLILGYVDIGQAVQGFSNNAVETVGCMLDLSHALVRSGLLEMAAVSLSSRQQGRKWMAVSIILFAVGLLSGLLNNTVVVAIFIPLVMGLCQRMHLSPSKGLIPLAYASIFGGVFTPISSSTNLLVSALAEEAGHRPLGMFEFTPLGLVFLVLDLSYTLLAAPRLLLSHTIRCVMDYRKRRTSIDRLFVHILDGIDKNGGLVVPASATFHLVETPVLNVRLRQDPSIAAP